MRCDECKHWKELHSYEGQGYGACSEIIHKMDITDIDGRNALIESIETDSDFFCAGFEPKED